MRAVTGKCLWNVDQQVSRTSSANFPVFALGRCKLLLGQERDSIGRQWKSVRLTDRPDEGLHSAGGEVGVQSQRDPGVKGPHPKSHDRFSPSFSQLP